MEPLRDAFRRQLTLAVGSAVALLVILTVSPGAFDLYAPRTADFPATRSLRAAIGPAGSALHPRAALVFLPAPAPPPPGATAVPLRPGPGLSRAQALADLLTGAPPELHGIALDAPLERIAVETVAQVAASRGLAVRWTGPREGGAPPGAGREGLEGAGTPGREDRLVARFLAGFERPAVNLHLLSLPPSGDPAADARRGGALLAALASHARAGNLFALAVVGPAGGSPSLVAIPGPPAAVSPAAPVSADPLDVAPTLAAALGLPAPAASPGRPVAALFADPSRLALRLPRETADGARLLAALARDLSLDARRATAEGLLLPGPGIEPRLAVRELFERALDKRDIDRRLLARSLAAILAVLALVGLFLLADRGRLPGGLPATLLHLALLLPVVSLALPRGTPAELLDPGRHGGAVFGATLLSLLYGVACFLGRAWFATPRGRRGDPRAILRALDDGLAPLAIAAALLAGFHLHALLDASLLALRFPDGGTLRTYLLALHSLHGALLALLVGSLAALGLLFAVSDRLPARPPAVR